MKPSLVALPVVLAMVLFPLRVFGNESSSPLGIAARLEARMAAGEGVLLPDADAEIVRHAGTVDLAEGDWPAAFLSRAGETICVAVSPFTGCYEFFDESGECFFTLVPVLPTTENWVAPFRHAEEGAHPDDALYAPWRLVDVWFLSHAESAETAERKQPKASAPRPRSGAAPDACAGPALGTTNNVGYLASVVDKSTTDEQRPPRYGRIECGLDSRTLNIGRFGQIE